MPASAHFPPCRAVIAALISVGLVLAVVWMPAEASRTRPAFGGCTVPADRLAVDDQEWAMVVAINGYRAGLGLAPLEISWTLQRAARWKANAFDGLGPVQPTFDDHDDADRGWERRFLDCGYPDAALFAENFGHTNDSGEAVLRFWQGSPYHAPNLVDPQFRFIGVARIQLGVVDGFPYYVWVADFGSAP